MLNGPSPMIVGLTSVCWGHTPCLFVSLGGFHSGCCLKLWKRSQNAVRSDSTTRGHKVWVTVRTTGGSAWQEGRVPGREWLEAGQASCAKLGSLNFISKATGSY